MSFFYASVSGNHYLRNLNYKPIPILTDIPTKEAMEIAIQDNYDQVKQDVREIVLREKVRLAQEANSD